MKKLKAIDFFCGIGGMTYGMREAGINVLAGIDNDITCKETYEINNPGAKFISADIKKLDESYLSEHLGIKQNDDNLIFIGCSPCQYWTIINTTKEKSKASKDLLNEFRRFIDYYKPGYIVIENVPGILKKSQESMLHSFLLFLDKDYKYDKKIINTKDFGIPQTRKRFLLIASRKKKPEITVPQLGYEPLIKDFIGVKNGFPRIEAGHRDNTEFFHSTCALTEINLERIKNTPKNGGSRLSWKNNPQLQLNCYKNRDTQFTDIYGRLSWDKTGPTITTKFYSISNGRFGHPEENRALSIREGATLQTFPKNFIFKGSSIGIVARHIGNAVPPKLAYNIAKIILE